MVSFKTSSEILLFLAIPFLTSFVQYIRYLSSVNVQNIST